jgi:hypothetical protein
LPPPPLSLHHSLLHQHTHFTIIMGAVMVFCLGYSAPPPPWELLPLLS